MQYKSFTVRYDFNDFCDGEIIDADLKIVLKVGLKAGLKATAAHVFGGVMDGVNGEADFDAKTAFGAAFDIMDAFDSTFDIKTDSLSISFTSSTTVVKC